MIRKLQRKFIMISGLAVIIVMVCVLFPVNLINRIRVGNELKSTIRFIMDSGGDFSRMHETETESGAGFNGIGDLIGRGRSLNLTPESKYQLRYFTVTIQEDGNVSDVSLSHIAAVDEKTAVRLSRYAMKSFPDSGFISAGSNSYFYYRKEADGGGRMIGFLECTREADSLQIFAYISIGFGLLLIAVFLVVIAFLSKKAMQPYIDNIESQREFITNAGHELKTPLAIIQANTEALELYTGESKWTRNIRAQTVRLSGLMQNLLTLSRMDEDSLNLEKKAFALYPLAGEVWENFAEPAAGRNLSFRIIDEEKEEARVLANRESIAQLLSILYDNAVKYTPRGGEIEVRICSAADSVRLIQSNTVSGMEGAKEIAEDPNRLFERFYRTDSDRSRKKGGYGIGLSAARAIAAANSGAISAGIGDGRILFTVTLKKAAREQTS